MRYGNYLDPDRDLSIDNVVGEVMAEDIPSRARLKVRPDSG